jgi:hypothetical protein
VHGQARGAEADPAELGVIEGGGAARGEAQAERGSGGTTVIAAGQEAADAHEGEGDAEERREAIEEGGDGLLLQMEVDRGDGDAEDQASVRGAAGAEDGHPRALGERGGQGAQGLEDVAAEERGDVAEGEGARLKGDEGAVLLGEAERGPRAEQAGDADEDHVVWSEPRRERVTEEPGDESGPHDRLRARRET